MFVEIINHYGTQIIGTLLVTVFGIFGMLLRSLAARYLDTPAKQRMAKIAVQFVEQTCKQLHGEEKLNAALSALSDLLAQKNIRATEEEMKRALHIACAEYILELPDGIDSHITERGGGLSEGQAQRIAVARSILRPGSILILDEVTSALDEATEQEMLKRLTQSQIGKTLIFVTHRPAVINYCTQMLKIEKPAKSNQTP